MFTTVWVWFSKSCLILHPMGQVMHRMGLGWLSLKCSPWNLKPQEMQWICVLLQCPKWDCVCCDVYQSTWALKCRFHCYRLLPLTTAGSELTPSSDQHRHCLALLLLLYSSHCFQANLTVTQPGKFPCCSLSVGSFLSAVVFCALCTK